MLKIFTCNSNILFSNFQVLYHLEKIGDWGTIEDIVCGTPLMKTMDMHIYAFIAMITLVIGIAIYLICVGIAKVTSANSGKECDDSRPHSESGGYERVAPRERIPMQPIVTPAVGPKPNTRPRSGPPAFSPPPPPSERHPDCPDCITEVSASFQYIPTIPRPTPKRWGVAGASVPKKNLPLNIGNTFNPRVNPVTDPLFGPSFSVDRSFGNAGLQLMNDRLDRLDAAVTKIFKPINPADITSDSSRAYKEPRDGELFFRF